MNLTASLVVRNEFHRYLPACLASLRTFCDQIIVLDDGSNDGSAEWLWDESDEQLIIYPQPRSTFFTDEGRTRERLLRLTLDRKPSHVLSVDADEFVDAGDILRALVEEEPDVAVWSLSVEEVWQATPDLLRVRDDGGWRTHERALLWRAPEDTARLRIQPRKLASGRIPMAMRRLPARETGVSLLHWGWADEATRKERHARYAKADSGRYHARRHLDSILWEDAQVTLREREWPAALLPFREALIPKVAA